MKFGVRDICDVVFKARGKTVIGDKEFKKGQPVLYIDSAKTSALEGSTTTVYATGGKGNAKLMSWEGEKSLTFTVEDALISPIGLSILAGAGLFKQAGQSVHVHTTAKASIALSQTSIANDTMTIDLSSVLSSTEEIDYTAPVFVSIAEEDGSITGELIEGLEAKAVAGSEDTRKVILYKKTTVSSEAQAWANKGYDGQDVFVDFYIVKQSANVSEIQIEPSAFGGHFYVEASTLFQASGGKGDLPAEITIPDVKIQSNFNFAMSATGDPSTFSFTMDAFPAYTMFDETKKVLCVIQVIEDVATGKETRKSVMAHSAGRRILESETDSTSSQTGEI